MGAARRPGSVAMIIAVGLVTTTARAEPPQPIPGEGILCALALYSVANEVARVCRPSDPPQLGVELGHAVDRLTEYITTNGGGTPAEVEEFKRQQGGVGRAADVLCKGDALMIYEGIRHMSPDALRLSVDSAVARPGKPTWGVCI